MLKAALVLIILHIKKRVFRQKKVFFVKIEFFSKKYIQEPLFVIKY